MVDLKELRIGNYLNIDGLAAPIGPGWFCSGHTLPKHEPIPLTPEWLEKLGLTFDPDDREKLIRLPGSPIDGLYCFDGEKATAYDKYYYKFMPDIRAVHQFQNLYFAITGKELEIKETA